MISAAQTPGTALAWLYQPCMANLGRAGALNGNHNYVAPPPRTSRYATSRWHRPWPCQLGPIIPQGGEQSFLMSYSIRMAASARAGQQDASRFEFERSASPRNGRPRHPDSRCRRGGSPRSGSLRLKHVCYVATCFAQSLCIDARSLETNGIKATPCVRLFAVGQGLRLNWNSLQRGSGPRCRLFKSCQRLKPDQLPGPRPCRLWFCMSTAFLR